MALSCALPLPSVAVDRSLATSFVAARLGADNNIAPKKVANIRVKNTFIKE